MIETLLVLAAIGVPAGAVVRVSLQRLGAVHAAELTAKAARHDDVQPSRSA